MKKVNLFIDMDGVLAVYHHDILTVMHNEGFFYNRPPIMHMLEVVKGLIRENDYNVYILSSVIDSPYCVPEKKAWLDKYLPEIAIENRVFVPYGTVKAEFVKDKVLLENKVNVLIDDYTENLIHWALPNPIPIKTLNGMNSTNGTGVSQGGNFIDIKKKGVDENISYIKRLIKERR